MSLEVRRVGPDDWSLWREVRQAGLRHDPEAFSATAHAWLGAWDVEDRWRARLAGGTSFVAVLDGEPVGSAAWDPVAGELVSMWVHPEARGTGVGTALVEAVVTAADGPVRLRVMADNAAGIRFYSARGFVLEGEAPDDEGTVGMVRSGG